LDRALHDEVDEVDDRRRFTAFLEAGDRFEHVLFDPAGQRGLLRRHFDAGLAAPPGLALAHREFAAALRRRAHQRFVGIATLDGLGDVAARRDDLLDAIAGLELE